LKKSLKVAGEKTPKAIAKEKRFLKGIFFHSGIIANPMEQCVKIKECEETQP